MAWAGSPWAGAPWAGGEVTSSGSQTLTPDLFTNSNTFYTHVITSSIVLLPNLFTNTQSFYTPTITVGSVTLTPSLYTNTNTFYTHVVSDGTTPPTITLKAGSWIRYRIIT